MINILICDDCSKTLKILKNIVTQFYQKINFKDYNIIAFNNYTDTISYVKNNCHKRFVYILDIDLGEEKNGLVLGKKIRQIDNYSGEIIFVTNHTELGFKAFQYKLRVLEFIDKTYTLNSQLKESLSIATEILLHNKEFQDEKKIEIRFGQQLFNIPLKDIMYFETIKGSGKVVLYTQNNILEFYSTLKELKDSLDDNFIQTHKTTIVNKNFIVNINKNRSNMCIELKNGIQCSLSKSGLKEVSEHWTR